MFQTKLTLEKKSCDDFVVFQFAHVGRRNAGAFRTTAATLKLQDAEKRPYVKMFAHALSEPILKGRSIATTKKKDNWKFTTIFLYKKNIYL